MMNVIEEHLALQNALSRKCGVHSLDEHEALVVTCLAGAQEFMEAIDFYKDKTKPWKAPSFDRHLIVEELIDVYHFLLQAWNILEVDSDEIDRVYKMKREKNFQRVKEKLNESATGNK